MPERVRRDLMAHQESVRLFAEDAIGDRMTNALAGCEIAEGWRPNNADHLCHIVRCHGRSGVKHSSVHTGTWFDKILCVKEHNKIKHVEMNRL